MELRKLSLLLVLGFSSLIAVDSDFKSKVGKTSKKSFIQLHKNALIGAGVAVVTGAAGVVGGYLYGSKKEPNGKIVGKSMVDSVVVCNGKLNSDLMALAIKASEASKLKADDLEKMVAAGVEAIASAEEALADEKVPDRELRESDLVQLKEEVNVLKDKLKYAGKSGEELVELIVAQAKHRVAPSYIVDTQELFAAYAEDVVAEFEKDLIKRFVSDK